MIHFKIVFPKNLATLHADIWDNETLVVHRLDPDSCGLGEGPFSPTVVWGTLKKVVHQKLHGARGLQPAIEI